MNIKAKKWNKLVRDKIPEIIDKNGGIAEVRILNEKEYLQELLVKLVEEAQEAKNADLKHLLEELTDVETVIDAILKLNGFSRDQFKKKQDEKDLERGIFEKRIFLIRTKEKKTNGTT